MKIDYDLAIHVFLAATITGIGYLLLLPINTFTTGSAFRHMSTVMSEYHWGFFFIISGNTGFVGCLSKSRILSLGSVFILSTTHAILALEFFLGNPTSLGAWVYGCVAALGYYLLVKKA